MELSREGYAGERSLFRYEAKLCQIGFRKKFVDQEHLQAQIDQTRRDGFYCKDLKSYYAEDYRGNPIWTHEDYG